MPGFRSRVVGPRVADPWRAFHAPEEQRMFGLISQANPDRMGPHGWAGVVLHSNL